MIQFDVLTSIHDAYTLSTTQDIDEIMKNNFLETLAAISLSIATRKAIHLDERANQCNNEQ
jgi:hypothetical protein